ncbi:MAG: hypothetical protein GC192_17205 [Bacteroidetes bacterium]|nr:hypothetical protein [Bacteroidota bacterium]
MKLLDRNNRIFIRFTSALLLFGSVLFYFAVNYITRAEIDEKLAVSQQHAIELIRNGQSIPQFPPVIQVEIITVKTAIIGYSNAMIYDPIEKEEEPYRQLISEENINGKIYRITNRTSLLESEDLILAIGGCTAALALLFFAWMYSRSSQQMWEPFQQQLNALRHFSLAQNEPISLAQSNISEFEELRAALHQLTEKLRSDYRSLKEFTENASHEIQTPLAIIRSKIEQLIENEAVSSVQMATLGMIYEAANRLSRLNQSLLLLTKIENQQFGEKSPVSVNTIIREQVEMLSELTDSKNLQLKTNYSDDLRISSHQALVEILVKNLLENAIRYSRPSDSIFIKTTAEHIIFSNPGEAAIEHPQRLFGRFHKHGNNGNSLGLGLAIVKKICEVNSWRVEYDFREGYHEFKVVF